MSAVTVGDHVEKARSEFLLEEGLLAAVCVDDCERVVSVHALRVPCLRVEAGAHACRIGVTHGLAPGLSAHGVLVVHNVDHQRKTALHIAFPEGLELVHGCEGHTFEDRTAGHCAVAEVSYDYALLAVDLLEESRTDRDGT